MMTGIAGAAARNTFASNPVAGHTSPSIEIAPKSIEAQQLAASQLLEPIDGAMASIGAKCGEYNKRNRSKCKWKNISYTIMKPEDWKKQIARFRGGCEAGIFSEEYNIVSNEKSWIVITSNGAGPTTDIHAALLKQGDMKSGARLVKLCDL